LEETARRLQEAAESMRRSAARSGNSGTEASTALDRLEEAQRRLQQSQEDRSRRDAENALRQVDELARQQRDVQSQVRELPESGAERADQISRLRERKDQMTEAVSDLERELDRSASVARGEQPEAARKFQEAADQIRESKLKEKLQFSRGTIEQWDAASATTLELNIEADLQALRERLEEASDAAGQRTVDPLEEALEDTRNLVQGMEALDRRLREPSEQPAGEQGAPQGQGGQAGQPTTGSENPAEIQGEASPLAGGATRGNPRRLSPEEVRQFRREFLQREDQVRDLSDQLSAAGQDAGDLQAVLRAMERLQRDAIYDDPAQVAQLQDEILQMLKRLEFGLRREVEGPSEGRAALGGSDDVPDEYRALVEEYYRKLAGSGRRGGSGN
jgi:chromosome segregation ATPase